MQSKKLIAQGPYYPAPITRSVCDGAINITDEWANALVDIDRLSAPEALEDHIVQFIENVGIQTGEIPSLMETLTDRLEAIDPKADPKYRTYDRLLLTLNKLTNAHSPQLVRPLPTAVIGRLITSDPDIAKATPAANYNTTTDEIQILTKAFQELQAEWKLNQHQMERGVHYLNQEMMALKQLEGVDNGAIGLNEHVYILTDTSPAPLVRIMSHSELKNRQAFRTQLRQTVALTKAIHTHEDAIQVVVNVNSGTLAILMADATSESGRIPTMTIPPDLETYAYGEKTTVQTPIDDLGKLDSIIASVTELQERFSVIDPNTGEPTCIVGIGAFPCAGRLSEKPELYIALNEIGITPLMPFLGLMERMGCKNTMNDRAVELGIPTMHTINVTDMDIDKIAALAIQMGGNVYSKAADGGGGTGIRKTLLTEVWEDLDTDTQAAILSEIGHDSDTPIKVSKELFQSPTFTKTYTTVFKTNHSTACRESQSNYGNQKMGLQTAVVKSRHLEGQVFAHSYIDENGNLVQNVRTIAIPRDCRIQANEGKLNERMATILNAILNAVNRDSRLIVAAEIAGDTTVGAFGTTVEWLQDLVKYDDYVNFINTLNSSQQETANAVFEASHDDSLDVFEATLRATIKSDPKTVQQLIKFHFDRKPCDLKETLLRMTSLDENDAAKLLEDMADLSDTLAGSNTDFVTMMTTLLNSQLKTEFLTLIRSTMMFYYLLELNVRLQVEVPVSEEQTLPLELNALSDDQLLERDIKAKFNIYEYLVRLNSHEQFDPEWLSQLAVSKQYAAMIRVLFAGFNDDLKPVPGSQDIPPFPDLKSPNDKVRLKVVSAIGSTGTKQSSRDNTHAATIVASGPSEEEVLDALKIACEESDQAYLPPVLTNLPLMTYGLEHPNRTNTPAWDEILLEGAKLHGIDENGKRRFPKLPQTHSPNLADFGIRSRALHTSRHDIKTPLGLGRQRRSFTSGFTRKQPPIQSAKARHLPNHSIRKTRFHSATPSTPPIPQGSLFNALRTGLRVGVKMMSRGRLPIR